MNKYEMVANLMADHNYDSVIDVFFSDLDHSEIPFQQKKRVIQFINSSIEQLESEDTAPDKDALLDMTNIVQGVAKFNPVSKSGKFYILVDRYIKNPNDVNIWEVAGQITDKGIQDISGFDPHKFLNDLVNAYPLGKGFPQQLLFTYAKSYQQSFNIKFDSNKIFVCTLNQRATHSGFNSVDEFLKQANHHDLAFFLAIISNKGYWYTSNSHNKIEFQFDSNTLNSFLPLFDQRVTELNDMEPSKIRGGIDSLNNIIKFVNNQESEKHLMPYTDSLLKHADKLVCIHSILNELVVDENFSIQAFQHILNFNQRPFSKVFKEKMNINAFPDSCKDKANLILNWSKKKGA